MSLLNFFAKQLLSWQQQSASPSPDFLAGGRVALEQAHAAFKAEPLLNYLHENHRLQLEMEELGYQLSRVRAQETRARQEIAALHAQLATTQAAVNNNIGRVTRIKKRLAKLSAAAFNPITRPGTKLKQLQNLIKSYADLANRQSAAFGAPSAPPLPLQS
jgi:chromosome segregation ATPase